MAHESFCGGIDRHEGHGLEGGIGGDIDDGPALFLHQRDEGARHGVQGRDIERDHDLFARRVEAGRRAEKPDPGIIDQNVRRFGLLQPFDDPVDHISFGEVRAQRIDLRFGIIGFQRALRGIDLGRIKADPRYLPAAFQRPARQRQPDPAGPAGDEDARHSDAASSRRGGTGKASTVGRSRPPVQICPCHGTTVVAPSSPSRVGP